MATMTVPVPFCESRVVREAAHIRWPAPRSCAVSAATCVGCRLDSLIACTSERARATSRKYAFAAPGAAAPNMFW